MLLCFPPGGFQVHKNGAFKVRWEEKGGGEAYMSMGHGVLSWADFDISLERGEGSDLALLFGAFFFFTSQKSKQSLFFQVSNRLDCTHSRQCNY